MVHEYILYSSSQTSMRSVILQSFLVDFLQMLKLTSIIVYFETDSNSTSNYIQTPIKLMMKRNLRVGTWTNDQNRFISSDTYPKLYLIMNDECNFPLKMVRETFKKKHDETYGKFHIWGGGSVEESEVIFGQ